MEYEWFRVRSFLSDFLFALCLNGILDREENTRGHEQRRFTQALATEDCLAVHTTGPQLNVQLKRNIIARRQFVGAVENRVHMIDSRATE